VPKGTFSRSGDGTADDKAKEAVATGRIMHRPDSDTGRHQTIPDLLEILIQGMAQAGIRRALGAGHFTIGGYIGLALPGYLLWCYVGQHNTQHI